MSTTMSGATLSDLEPSNFWYALATTGTQPQTLLHLLLTSRHQVSLVILYVLANLLLSLGSNYQVNCIKAM